MLALTCAGGSDSRALHWVSTLRQEHKALPLCLECYIFSLALGICCAATFLRVRLIIYWSSPEADAVGDRRFKMQLIR